VFSLSGALKTEHFVAREEELAQIDQVLRSGDGRQTVTLHGLGGIGKTQLAIAYAIRHRADFSAIFWFNIKDNDSVKQSFARAARRIATDCPSSALGDLDEEKDLDKVVRAVNHWLDQPKNTRWLMVFDNYDNSKLPGVTNPTVVDIHRFLPEAYHGSVLITTRLAAVKLGRQIPIQKLSNLVDGLRILSDSSGRNINAEGSHSPTLSEY
jgi:ATP/maltotriose-dependent transcriptional regulator MalT